MSNENETIKGLMESFGHYNPTIADKIYDELNRLTLRIARIEKIIEALRTGKLKQQ